MYSIKRITTDEISNDEDLWNYFYKKGKELSDKYPMWNGWLNMPQNLFDQTYVWFALDTHGNPKGLLMAELDPCYFNPKKTMLVQTTLSGDNPRATATLYKHLIDFGKANADYICTNIGHSTNIKPSSLHKMGFKESETTYIMEV